MLEMLFGSRARVKILKIFLLHPEEKYYIRQLSRDLKLQVNSVRRELENLEKFGVLISDIRKGDEVAAERDENFYSVGSIKGNITLAPNKKKKKIKKKKINKRDKKYYQTNSSFVLFNEIKALIVKAQILHEKDFIEKLKNIGKIKLLVLSGVFANNPISPVDLLIVGKVNKRRLLKLIKELERELGAEVNFTAMDAGEFKYRKDITDTFLYGILEGKRLVVIDEIGLL